MSRSERARRVATRHWEFLEAFAPEAREVLDKVLDRYAMGGAEELEVGALRSGAYEELGTIFELTHRFGGTNRLHSAMDELNALVYETSAS